MLTGGWGVPAAEEPDGDEPHDEQGHIRAPSEAVPYDKDWGGIGRATDKLTASLRLLRRVRSMVNGGHLQVVDDEMACGCCGLPDHGYGSDAGRRAQVHQAAMRAHSQDMGDLWAAAQVARRREEGDSEVMADLRGQWEDVRRFTTRMPTWTAVAKTDVFRFRNLLLKWRRKATAADARQPKITQWLTAGARERRATPGTAGRLTAQQAPAEARASRTRRRAQSAGHTASLQSTMRRWAHGAPNGANDADQTPPEDYLLPEPNSPGGATSGR